MTTWINTVPQIVDGQPVDSRFAGAPDRALTQNVRHLKERLDELSAATALHDFDRPMADTVAVGMAVYWNESYSRYEPALAAVLTDPTTGYLLLAPSALVLGICDAKSNSTTGHVLLLGLGELSLTAVVTGTPTAGRYFLSSQTAGHLTKQQPAIGIPVLTYQAGKVFVQPLATEVLLSHTHFGIELYAKPAGYSPVPAVGDPHSITVPDADATGWLPANDDSFEGLAPTGAKFGYNLAAHPALRALWPPTPLGAVSLGIERPAAYEDVLQPFVGETLLSDSYVTFDANGIWWYSDCFNHAPWPADYVADAGSSSLMESVSTAEACGPVRHMRLKLYFNRMLYGNADATVTSLRSNSAALQVLSCAGLAATSGDLQLLLDLGLAVTTATATGHVVFKSLEDNTFLTGPVLEGVVAGSDNVILSSTASRRLVPGDASSALVHQGITTLTVSTEPGERELSPEIIKLESAKERHHNATDIPYIGFSSGAASSILLIFNVPSTGLPVSPAMQVRMLLLGAVTGTLPALTMTRVAVGQPDAVNTGVAMPTDTDIASVALNTARSITADSYMEIRSDAFDVVAGDTIYVSLARSNSDGYAGEVGVLRINGVILAG